MNSYASSALEGPFAWCRICDLPVPLETSKADEQGQAVHEDCYVERLVFDNQMAWPRKRPTPVNPKEPQPSAPAKTTSRAKPISSQMPSWALDVALVAIIVSVSCWLAYGNYRPVFAPATVNAFAEQPAAFTTAQDPAPVKPAFKRIRIDQNEVDYIAEDVTIRHFTHDAALLPKPVGYEQVNFGDDVTVRYFPSKLSQAADPSQPALENSATHTLAQ